MEPRDERKIALQPGKSIERVDSPALRKPRVPGPGELKQLRGEGTTGRSRVYSQAARDEAALVGVK